MPDPGRPVPRPQPAPRPRPQPPRGRQPAVTAGQPPAEMRAAGPLGSVIQCRRDGDSWRLGGLSAGASALVVLNRIAFFNAGQGRLDDDGKRALLRWACGQQLGQDDDLVAAVARRREAALRALAVGPRSRYHLRLRAEPEWRLAVGLGDNANAHEIGLALHGTYGWPVIPGSSLKGLAAAWASSQADPADVQRVLGTPRRDVQLPAAGTMCFLDAIPAGRPVTIEADVLTPHVKPYYDSMATGSGTPVPPAEYHNPVPLAFLTVRGAYAVDLYGRNSHDVSLAAEWLEKAGDELGAGAKTAAGYGYLRIFEVAGEGGSA